MAYNTSYISQVTLPDNNTYDIKDAWAREKLSGLTGAMHFVGVSTTETFSGIIQANIELPPTSGSFSKTSG